MSARCATGGSEADRRSVWQSKRERKKALRRRLEHSAALPLCRDGANWDEPGPRGARGRARALQRRRGEHFLLSTDYSRHLCHGPLLAVRPWRSAAMVWYRAQLELEIGWTLRVVFSVEKIGV